MPLVCRRLVAATGEPDVKQHYEAEHEYYEAVCSGGRARGAGRLRRGDLPSRPAHSGAENSSCRPGTRPPLGLEGLRLGRGDVHRCMAVMLNVLPDHVGVMDGIDLSPETTRQRVLDIHQNLRSQLLTELGILSLFPCLGRPSFCGL